MGEISNYTYSVDECDVSDPEALVEYRKKRSEWLHWLDGDEDHAVWQQIHVMMWSDSTFRLVNESRRVAATNKRASCLLNGDIARFVDKNYALTQVLAIRRLLDKRKDVISICKVLEEVRKHKHLLSRENFVCYDGLPYDFQKVGRQFNKQLMHRDTVPPLLGISTNGPTAFNTAKRCHEKAYPSGSGATECSGDGVRGWCRTYGEQVPREVRHG